MTETLVKPYKSNRLDLISKHLDFMAAYLSVIPLDTEIAKTAAKLRAEHNLKAFDAIQVATAITNQADFILTNDFHLTFLSEPEILVLSNLPGGLA